MTSIPRLGHRCSNQYARLILQSLIEVAGENGMRAVCRLAGLAALIDDLPPENEAREFDHSDLAAIFQTLNEIFGSHGSRSLAFKAGQMTVVSMLELTVPISSRGSASAGNSNGRKSGQGVGRRSLHASSGFRSAG